MVPISIHLQSTNSSSSVHCSSAVNARKCTPLLDSTARQGHTNQEAAVQTKLKDNARMWLWGFLAVIAMSQLYLVQELLAAFVLFALGFAVIAFVVAGLYMLQQCLELAAARLADIRQPVMNVTSVSRENQKAA